MTNRKHYKQMYVKYKQKQKMIYIGTGKYQIQGLHVSTDRISVGELYPHTKTLFIRFLQIQVNQSKKKWKLTSMNEKLSVLS